jgi:NitT/TauT family transport system ATP-binding protein
MSSFQYTRTDTLLDIQDVSVSYGNKPILKNMTARIRDVIRPGMTQGQIVGLLGPSGIGKTTLFKVLAGILTPDTGQVLIGSTGKLVTPGNVGVVAQNYPLLDHRTVMSNLVFSGQQTGLNKKEARELAKHSLEEFNMLEHADKYPIQLSGGQRQRVAIAQQLICSQHFLVLDEPFSGLDVIALTKVRELFLDVSTRDEKNTFIIVTHDVTSAVAIADTIWLMGRDRDANGDVIPGARLMEEIDLIERDICWHDDVVNRPPAVQLIREIKEKFLKL